MKVLALIPARAGSKGIPNKNILDLCGHPLLAWSIKAALDAKNITKVVVSTDSSLYAKIALSYGAEVPFIRPAEISGDKSTDYEFVKHAIDHFENSDEHFDLVAHIRPTSPLRDPKVIDRAIDVYEKIESSHTSLRSAHVMSESAYKCFELKKNHNLVPVGFANSGEQNSNLPRQMFPKTYLANGYVDILSVEYIKRAHELHGSRIFGFITEPIFELDEMNDLDLIKLQCKNNNMLEKMFGCKHG